MEKNEVKKDDYSDLIQKIARKVVDWRLTAPAIVILESSKPISFVASQVLVFFDPIVKSFFNIRDYERFYMMIEDRKNLERLILAIEAEEEKRRQEKDNQKKDSK